MQAHRVRRHYWFSAWYLTIRAAAVQSLSQDSIDKVSIHDRMEHLVQDCVMENTSNSTACKQHVAAQHLFHDQQRFECYITQWLHQRRMPSATMAQAQLPVTAPYAALRAANPGQGWAI